MDNIRSALEIVFRRTPPESVIRASFPRQQSEIYPGLEQQSQYICQNYPDKQFTLIAREHMHFYSTDQISALYQQLGNKLLELDDTQRARRRRPEFDVFKLLVSFSQSILVDDVGGIRCRYKQLLRWRAVSHLISEDIFTTSFLAYKDNQMGYESRRFFAWPFVIKTDNLRLHNLLKEGVADNHFHLKASNPVYDFNWIYLMNNILQGNANTERIIGEIENAFLSVDAGYEQMEKLSAYQMCTVAASIRWYLFKWIKNNFEATDSKAETDRQKIIRILEIPDSLSAWQAQREIHQEELTYLPKNNLDYANELGCGFPYGERKLMYEMFLRIYKGVKGDGFYSELLYIYLLIKTRIRSEFVQVNARAGFDNFQQYEHRKEKLFIEDARYRKAMFYMALNKTLASQNIVSMEARIVPKATAEETAAYIQEIDDVLGLGNCSIESETTDERILYNYLVSKKNDQDTENYLKPVFYVCHFPKRPDINLKQLKKDYYNPAFHALLYSGACRHYDYRAYLRKAANELVRLRNHFHDSAKRVYGIDACSNELECRPEVFAPAFRYLTNHKLDPILPGGEPQHSLRITYHVGEDFYDVVDGLRAIEEAIRFLNLGQGSRIGHALALGCNVKQWYDLKRRKIVLPLQNLIDNLAWLHSRINKFRLEEFHSYCDELERDFEKYYNKVYGSVTVPNGEIISIKTYFDSWKLRGDDPILYESLVWDHKGETVYKDVSPYVALHRRGVYFDEWSAFMKNRRYGETPSNLAQKLYHSYHYDADVKFKGSQMEEYYIDDIFIRVVELVQKHMQRLVNRHYIAIESNPSSNVLIGSFDRYDEHPIQSWYNIGLGGAEHRDDDIPQMFVSINTDDQGIFNTCIENEYALLALALEKQGAADYGSGKQRAGSYGISGYGTGDQGTAGYSAGVHNTGNLSTAGHGSVGRGVVHNQTRIYNWLDNIRRMGLEQSFKLNNGEPTEY